MRQVIITVCLICKTTTINCYDSERNPKKIFCGDCKESRCPIPTQGYSSGFCDQHFQGQLEKLKQRQLKEMNNA